LIKDSLELKRFYPEDRSLSMNRLSAQKTTMLDVAKHAQVSAATVSRVLAQQACVRQQTRQRVLQSVHVLRYKPNPAAAALASFRKGLRRPKTVPRPDQISARNPLP
jgi:hypothetical protein